MIAIALGIFTIILGAKAFSTTGIPLTRQKNLTGTTAKIIGTICILFGVVLIGDGIFSMMRVMNR